MWGERGRIIVVYTNKGTKRNSLPLIFLADHQESDLLMCSGWCFALLFSFWNMFSFFDCSPSLECHVMPLPGSAAETWLPKSHQACWRRPGWGNTARGPLSDREKRALCFHSHETGVVIDSKMNECVCLEKPLKQCPGELMQIVSRRNNIPDYCHHLLRGGSCLVRTLLLCYGNL